MNLEQKILYGVEILVWLILGFFVLWGLLKLYIKYCRNKNPKYNQFGKTALNKDEKTFIAKWRFDIDAHHENNDMVTQHLNPEMQRNNDEFDDYELRVEFKQEVGVTKVVRSMHEIAMSAKYRYFEVEVIENQKNSEIYVGVIDSREEMPQLIPGGI